jgi:aspartyl-tRNA(Asn)/glutamyl-tRNA(Gln) amidotransferase subunit B
VLVAEKEMADFYEELAQGRDPKLAANWMTVELFGLLNKAGKDVTSSPVSAQQLGGLVDLLSDRTLSGPLAKKVLERMFETGRDARDIVEAEGLKQVTDTGAIEAVVDQVMAANPEKLAEIRAGKDKLMGWFVGQVMKAAGGKANPGVVNEILKRKLAG